jgi:hypothetical protein
MTNLRLFSGAAIVSCCWSAKWLIYVKARALFDDESRGLTYKIKAGDKMQNRSGWVLDATLFAAANLLNSKRVPLFRRVCNCSLVRRRLVESINSLLAHVGQ